MGLQKRTITFQDKEFPHYYLCTYIPRYRGNDFLSRSLVHFKKGDTPHNHAWTDCATTVLNWARALKYTHVIRVPGHSELTYNSNSTLHQLSVSICNILKGTYTGSLLEKIRETRKLAGSDLKGDQRAMEVKGAFRFHAPSKARHILIIDDILTTGSTVTAIMDSILAVLPDVQISVFTLAHTNPDVSVNKDIVLKGKQYYYDDSDESWMIASENSPEYATTLAALKTFIMNDSFPD